MGGFNAYIRVGRFIGSAFVRGRVEIIIAQNVGTETTTYVRNIYKYYIAYKLTFDAQAEAEKARGQVAPAKD